MDFFDQKTKKLFAKNTNADKTSIRFLEAMSRKLERDYLSLFNKLIFEYKIGNIKKESRKAADLVSATILRLNTVVESGIVSNEDEKLILSNVEQIEQYKKLLIDSASKTIAFRKRLERIEKETGISIEDLTISKSIAKKVVGKARGGPSVSKFAARKVGEYAGERASELAQSITTGLLGPFGFMVGDVFKGLKSVAKYSKLQGRRKKEEKTLLALKEHSAGADTLLSPDVFKRVTGQSSTRRKAFGFGHEKSDVSPYSRVKSKRKDQDTALEPREAKEKSFLKIPEMRFGHEKLMVGGLFHFFNKDAYRAKWTSELLKAVKGKHDGVEIGSRLSGLLGKAGQLTALAVAVGFTIDQFNKLKNVMVDFEKSRKLESKSADQLINAIKQKVDKIKEVGGIEAYGSKVGKSPRQVAIDLASSRQRALIDKVQSRPWWVRSIEHLPPMKLIGLENKLNPLKHEKPFYERVSGIERSLSRKQLIDVPIKQSVEDITKHGTGEVRLSGKKSGGVVPSYKRGAELQKDIVKTRDLTKIRPEEDHTKDVVSEVKKLNKNFEDWYKKLGMSKSNISAAGIRNVNDSSDPLIGRFNGTDGLRVGD